MFDELTNAIKAQLYEKAISPLSGAFILSWVVWNYRFVLVLVSSLSYPEKISYIDNLPISQQTFLYGFFLPLLSASALIVLYPYPAKFFYEISRIWQKELKEAKQRIDDEMPMDQEEARKIRREALQASIAFDNELKSKNEEIARLKEEVRLLTPKEKIKLGKEPSARFGTSETPPQSNDKMDESMLIMLRKVAEFPDGIARMDIISRSGVQRIEAEYCLDELINKGFVNSHYNQMIGDFEIKIGQPGRAYLLNKPSGKR